MDTQRKCSKSISLLAYFLLACNWDYFISQPSRLLITSKAHSRNHFPFDQSNLSTCVWFWRQTPTAQKTWEMRSAAWLWLKILLYKYKPDSTCLVLTSEANPLLLICCLICCDVWPVTTDLDLDDLVETTNVLWEFFLFYFIFFNNCSHKKYCSI